MGYKIISKNIIYKKLKDINIQDEFFDPLKYEYPELEKWFKRKSDEFTYVHYRDDESIDGFLYLKIEENLIDNTAIKQIF